MLSIALYDSGQSTVLILPLLAMHDEYRHRARKYGLSCETWTNSNRHLSSQIILVAVENCVWDELKDHIASLILMGRLSRIVIDEAHLLHKHASFRPCVDMLEYLGRMPTSILLMTATCPPSLEQSLFAKLGRQVYQVIRRSTDRPEIAQRMVAMSSKDMEKDVAADIKSITQQFRKQDRALLFCLSHNECDRMAELLDWKPYHASIPLEERARYMKMWRDGEICGLASTSMLNCCLDYPGVRSVFHMRPPRDVIDYCQAIGRAARNGEAGQSIVYFDPSRLKRPQGEDPYGDCVIYDMLTDNSTCRRLRSAMFLDGSAVTCAMLPAPQLCDVCEGEATRAPPEGGPSRFPSHLVSALVKLPDTGSPTTSVLRPAPAVSIGESAQNHQAQASNPFRANLSGQPAPLATFGNHFAAAQAAMKRVPNPSEESGLIIRNACQALMKSCVHCWAYGVEYHSHELAGCALHKINEAHPQWKTWRKLLKFPAGCCFFCGCPTTVRCSCRQCRYC
jgi:hypothetical protein